MAIWSPRFSISRRRVTRSTLGGSAGDDDLPRVDHAVAVGVVAAAGTVLGEHLRHRVPRLRADDAVDDQAVGGLEAPHGGGGRGAESAVVGDGLAGERE